MFYRGLKQARGIALLALGVGSFLALGFAAETPPQISTLVKPAILKKVKEDREVVAFARLETLKDELKRYSLYSSMQVKAGLPKTYRILTDYRLYPKMVPYVEKADYDEKTHILLVEGGIWKFKVISSVHFQEISDRWIRYEIVAGHFKGLKGNIYFEPASEKGTLVYIHGEQEGTHWPPQWIIERGAEIVFGFTAKRMRTYIETEAPGAAQNDTEVPKPRTHL